MGKKQEVYTQKEVDNLLQEEREKVVEEIRGEQYDWVEINEFKISPRQQRVFNKIFDKYLSKKGEKK